MKAFTSLLACAVALFMTTIPACATPPATPSGTSWELPHFTFEPMSAEKQAELRHAIVNCAKVEMRLRWLPKRLYRSCSDKRWQLVERTQDINGWQWTDVAWVRELPRSAELDAVLVRLASVQQWYMPVFDKRIHVNPSRSLSIRLLDAEGRELYQEDHAYGPWISCMGEQGERVSFKDFFPDFPDWKCFGK